MDAFAPDLFEAGLVAGVLEDARFLTRFHRDLDPEYFSSEPARWLVTVAVAYYAEHAQPPPRMHLAQEIVAQLRNGLLNDSRKDILLAYCARLGFSDVDREYVLTHAGDFLQREALRCALEQISVDAELGRVDQVQTRIDAALKVGRVDETTHYELFRQASAWTHNLRDRSRPFVTTGIPTLDTGIGGGLRRGELGVWLAPTNRGKSHLLVWCGYQAALAGRTVLHVTLEMGEAQVFARYAACALAIDSLLVFDLGDEVARRMAALAAERPEIGGVYPVRQTPRLFTVSDLRAVYNQFRDRGVEIDVMVIDYPDLMRGSSSAREAQWIEQGRVFEDLHGLMGDLDVVGWAATQSGRAGLTKDEIGLEDVGESYAKAKPADVIIAVNQTQSERVASANQPETLMQLAPVKVRGAPIGPPVAVIAEWAYSRLRLRDVSALPPAAPAWAGFTLPGVSSYVPPAPDGARDLPF